MRPATPSLVPSKPAQFAGGVLNPAMSVRTSRTADVAMPRLATARSAHTFVPVILSSLLY